MSGERRFPAGAQLSAVQYMERGHSVDETATVMGITTDRVRGWWKKFHPNLPIHEPDGKTAFLRDMGCVERMVKLAVYECPYCGGLIYHPILKTIKPWHCHWCGREVK